MLYSPDPLGEADVIVLRHCYLLLLELIASFKAWHSRKQPNQSWPARRHVVPTNKMPSTVTHSPRAWTRVAVAVPILPLRGKRNTISLWLNPNPPKGTEGRREDSRRGVRKYRGDGLGSIGVAGGGRRTAFNRRTGPLWPSAGAAIRGMAKEYVAGNSRGPDWREFAGTFVSCRLAFRPGVEWLAAGPSACPRFRRRWPAAGDTPARRCSRGGVPPLGHAAGPADGGVHVDGQGLVARSCPGRPGPCQQPAAHPVQLSDMAPAKAAQEGAQGR